MGLDYTGDKENLRQSILKSLVDINSLVQVEEDSETAEEEENDELEEDDDLDGSENLSGENGENENDSIDEHVVVSENDDRNRTRKNNKVTFSVGFRDVEETTRDFNGEDEF